MAGNSLGVRVLVVVEEDEARDGLAIVRLPVVDAARRVAVGKIHLKELDVAIERCCCKS